MLRSPSRIFTGLGELLVFSCDLLHVGIPLAAVEPDRALLAGAEAFADCEDLGRDLLDRVELALRRADPFGAEIGGADRRIREKARGVNAATGDGLAIQIS